MPDVANHGRNWADLWSLDPDVVFLNHGSFGACPREVLAHQRTLRDRVEREPVHFFARELEGLMDGAREVLATFVGADAEDLAFVPNATTGVNSVLRSLTFSPDDELLITNHAYNACRNALNFVADRSGARVVVADLPFPVGSPDEVVEAILSRASERTRLALIDHVTSQTGLVLPIERIVADLNERGIETLVDGAHAPGMLPLDISRVGASFYTGNCHKWICAPKGAGFLHVRRDRQPEIRPVTISHGANTVRSNRSRYLLEFDWMGTVDPTAILCVPEAIRFMGELLPGGWPALVASNRDQALKARDRVCARLGIPAPAPDAMIGTLVAFPIPDGSGEPPTSSLYIDPLQDELMDRFRIEIPVIPWPAPPKRVVRFSSQIYNRPHQYDLLADALATVLEHPG